MKKIFPYISLIGISAFVGNMLVIGFGFGTYWKSLEPLEFMRQFSIQFPNLLIPTMGILLPALIATIILVVQSKNHKEARINWLIALAGLIIACTITSIYHLPTNFGFMESKYTAEQAISKLNTWMLLHWVRTAVVFVSAIYSIKAFQISNNNQ